MKLICKRNHANIHQGDIESIGCPQRRIVCPIFSPPVLIFMANPIGQSDPEILNRLRPGRLLDFGPPHILLPGK
jgi:hypothetical protein